MNTTYKSHNYHLGLISSLYVGIYFMYIRVYIHP